MEKRYTPFNLIDLEMFKDKSMKDSNDKLYILKYQHR